MVESSLDLAVGSFILVVESNLDLAVDSFIFSGTVLSRG